VLALVLGQQVLSLWMGTVLAQKGLSKEDLLKAIRLTPDNPEPFYKLSVYHQLNLFNIDAEESYRNLQKAIERNPLEQEYWLSLAKALQRLEKKEESERALDNAIFVFRQGIRADGQRQPFFSSRGILRRPYLTSPISWPIIRTRGIMFTTWWTW